VYWTHEDGELWPGMGLVKGRSEDNHTYEVYFKPVTGTTKEEKIYDKPEEDFLLFIFRN
jgi:hypothetical protein